MNQRLWAERWSVSSPTADTCGPLRRFAERLWICIWSYQHNHDQDSGQSKSLAAELSDDPHGPTMMMLMKKKMMDELRLEVSLSFER